MFYGLQYNFSAIHGDKSQSERDHVLRSFREGRTPILVATDVASRGLGMYKVRQKWSHFQLSFARLEKLRRKKERRIITPKIDVARRSDDWLSILIGPGLRPLLIGPWFRTVGRERERSSRLGSLGLLGRWWSRDYFEPHNSGINCTRSLHADCWEAGVFFVRKVGMIWYLWSFQFISFIILPSNLKICHFRIQIP